MYKYIASNKLSGPKTEIEDILDELKECLEEKYIQQHSAMKRVSELYLKQKNKQPETDSFHLYLEVVNTVFNETGGQRMRKVSGNTHTKNQINPNNATYWKSREKGGK